MSEQAPETTPQPPTLKIIYRENERFLVAVTSVTIALVGILLINLLRLGGDRFTLVLDCIVGTLAAFLAANFAQRVRQTLRDDHSAEQIWLSIFFGLIMWGAIETFRLIPIIINTKIEFPALAWLWLLGYPPVLHGLYERYKDIQTDTSPWQNRLMLFVGGLGAVFILVALLLPAIFWPVVPGLTTNFLPVLYTLIDFVLLIGVMRIVFTYRGTFAGPWRFFAIAFGVKIVGDVALRYPDQFAIGQTGLGNFLLGLANFAHYTWYTSAMLGMFVYILVLTHDSPTEAAAPATEHAIPNASALVFTDKDDMVIRTSLNFRYLLRLPDEIATSKLPLRELLGISQNVYADYKAQLLEQGKTSRYAIEPAYLRKGQKAWLTASMARDALEKYNGVDMVVQVLAEGVGGAQFTSEERALAENIFWQAGVEGEESFKLLIDYFNTHYKMLSTMAIEYEGSRRAAGLSEQVNQAATRQKLPVRVLEQEIMVTGSVKLQDLGNAVGILLKTARGYVSSLAGPEIVRRETEQLNMQLDRSTRNLLERFKLAK